MRQGGSQILQQIDMRIVYHDIDKKSKNKLNLFAAMDSGYSISYLLLPC